MAKSTFTVTTSKMLCPQPRSQHVFLTNRGNSCRSGFKFRIEFGCTFGNEKDDHHFVRVKASKEMNTFIPHVMPGTPPNQASMLSTLMAAARAKSAAFVHIKNDDNIKLEIDDDDDDAYICIYTVAGGRSYLYTYEY